MSVWEQQKKIDTGEWWQILHYVNQKSLTKENATENIETHFLKSDIWKACKRKWEKSNLDPKR